MPSSSNYQKHTQSKGLRRRLIDRFNARLADMVGNLLPPGQNQGKSQSQNQPQSQNQSPATAPSLLDVGCGEGVILSLLGKAHPSLKLAGCDISQVALEQARRIAPAAHVVPGSAYQLPFADGSFDIALLSEVLEHLENPEAALAELARVSRRYVVVTVPHEPFFRLGNLASGKYPATWGNHPEHIQHFGPAGLKKLCDRNFQPLGFARSFPWLLYCGQVRQ